MRSRTMPILSIVLLASACLQVGCRAGAAGVADRPGPEREVHRKLTSQLVLPAPGLLELAGSSAWPAGQLNILNHRRNEALGADRIPLMASVDEAEVRVWDQQWILNGRSRENYLRSTRSIQYRDQP
ncbi:MAG: hypothetical protein CMJ41_07980 [Phycisphaerae bacterium]|nr:hypothetical protein [Phycisphaerae bacterium]